MIYKSQTRRLLKVKQEILVMGREDNGTKSADRENAYGSWAHLALKLKKKTMLNKRHK